MAESKAEPEHDDTALERMKADWMRAQRHGTRRPSPGAYLLKIAGAGFRSEHCDVLEQREHVVQGIVYCDQGERRSRSRISGERELKSWPLACRHPTKPDVCPERIEID